MATVTLNITQKDDIVHVDSVLTGGIKGTSEDIPLNDEFMDRNDHIWGKYKVKANKVAVADIDDEELKEGWVGDEVVRIESVHDGNGWTAVQVSIDTSISLLTTL